MANKSQEQEALRQRYTDGVPLQTAWIVYAPISDREDLYQTIGSDEIDDVEKSWQYKELLLRRLRAGRLMAIGVAANNGDAPLLCLLKPDLCVSTYISFSKGSVSAPNQSLREIVVVAEQVTRPENALLEATPDPPGEQFSDLFSSKLLHLGKRIEDSKLTPQGRGRPSKDSIIIESMIALSLEKFDFFDDTLSATNAIIAARSKLLFGKNGVSAEAVRLFRKRYGLISR